jgi:uncharacterized protein YggE
MAIEKARAQAEAMAAALGGELGPVLHATTAGNEVRYVAAASAMIPMNMTGTPVSPAEVVVTASVLTRWAFIGRR